MNRGFLCFMFNCIVVGFKDYLGKKFNCLGEELALERKSEFGDLSL